MNMSTTFSETGNTYTLHSNDCSQIYLWLLGAVAMLFLWLWSWNFSSFSLLVRSISSCIFISASEVFIYFYLFDCFHFSGDGLVLFIYRVFGTVGVSTSAVLNRCAVDVFRISGGGAFGSSLLTVNCHRIGCVGFISVAYLLCGGHFHVKSTLFWFSCTSICIFGYGKYLAVCSSLNFSRSCLDIITQKLEYNRF